MKKIPLRTLADERFPEAPSIEYAQVLREVVRRPLDPQKGVDMVDARFVVLVEDVNGA